MAIDARKCLAVIIEKIEAQKTVEKQIEFLILHSSSALKTVIGYGLDPGCVWLLPKGDPPYKPLFEAADQEGRLYNECKKLIYFVDSDEGREVAQLRRELMFVQILESVDPRDAKLLLRMKNRQLKINIEAVKKAFPNFAGHWVIVPEPVVKENNVAKTKKAKV